VRDVNKYIETLIKFAEEKLKKYFKIEKLDLDEFEIVNSYLIYQTIRENKKNINTLIHIPDKKTKSQFYIPAIFTLALYDFVDNYIDDATEYEVGDIVQKDGQRYQITNKRKDEFELSNNKFNTIKKIKRNSMRSYIVTTADLKERHVKLKFDSYRNFFKSILNVSENELPSKFKYKAIIITDKKIEKELKQYKIKNHNIPSAVKPLPQKNYLTTKHTKYAKPYHPH